MKPHSVAKHIITYALAATSLTTLGLYINRKNILMEIDKHVLEKYSDLRPSYFLTTETVIAPTDTATCQIILSVSMDPYDLMHLGGYQIIRCKFLKYYITTDGGINGTSRVLGPLEIL